MKRYLATLMSVLLINHVSFAGLITHTDYTSGATITAAGQNSNENTIFNEFNGNIESANIKDGTIVNADVSASANIAVTKLQSSLTNSVLTTDSSGAVTSSTAAINGGLTVRGPLTVQGSSLTIPSITNWVVYTPTYGAGFGTTSSSNMYWRRVGDTVQIRGTFTIGTVAGSAASVTMPNSIVADNTGKVQTTQNCGYITGSNSTKINRVGIVSPNSNLITFGITDTSGTSAFTAQNGNSIFITGENVYLQCEVPINGWSI